LETRVQRKENRKTTLENWGGEFDKIEMKKGGKTAFLVSMNKILELKKKLIKV